MAKLPALSTAGGGEICIGSEIRDSFSLLDVLCANQFEGESLNPEFLEQTEINFYRGAPPEWLNFHISELAESDGAGTPLIKRDGYKTLVGEIYKKKRGPGTSTIKLFHQQGCGGTTLAMQVLWDLRKTFRCAVLKGSASHITNIAKEVVDLFTAGSRGNKNTVLLLLNNEQILENLQDSIMEEIAEQELDTDMPVVILFSCVRASDQVILEKEDSYTVKQHKRKYVILKKELSDTEKQKFNEKKEELCRRYSEKYKHFHGFNIMQTNFSQAYIQEACTVFTTIKKTNRHQLVPQLAAFLSLLNAYVPGSYLLESQCLDFLNRKDSVHGDLSLEDRMEPFNDLIVIFQQDKRFEKKVCMAHPMIAQHCIELMDQGRVSRSDTARNFLTCFCGDEVPPFLFSFIKDMLTKREMKKKINDIEKDEKEQKGREEDQEKFSRLILDIKEREDEKQSASVLKVASNKFAQNSLFPQALARFYYIELKDYNKAEMWAETGKERDPNKSFIADTLGQVHKNHLKNKKHTASNDEKTFPRQILQLAAKAIDAFQHEEHLAENERRKDMKEDGTTKVLRALNTRGQLGYLQVCNLLYDLLVSQNEIWKSVLTKSLSLGSVLGLLGDGKLFRFNDLINSLRDEVEKRWEFFYTFLMYSESVMKKDDATYICREVSECYRKYVGDSAPKHKEKSDETIQKLKEKQAATSAGVLSCLDRRCTASELKQIATWWKEICLRPDSTRLALANFILANIMLINKDETPCSSDYQNAFRQKMPLRLTDAPELHLLALLICWPAYDEDKCVSDLNQLITQVKHSYECEYKTHFQSRYLRPLFFMGNRKGLSRNVHRRVLDILWMKDALQDSNTNWRAERIFKDPLVQERLLKVEGVVRNYRLYATFGGTEIELDVNQRNNLWKSGQVSFYLGFTISGPVAYSIQPRATTEGPEGTLKQGVSSGAMDSSHWTKVEPEVKRVDDVQTYSLHSEAGHYECNVSALRWVCDKTVRFRFQFCSWEEHIMRPSCIDYMPAGPLLDITVITGKLEEVHLPHWIDHNSTTPDMFAVLHVDSCGDFVEQVSEVTSSHVKLFQPVFSPRGTMILKKLGFPVKVRYDVLIYKTIKTALTLHVYLVPRHPVLQQAVEREEKSDGSKRIQKPNPDKSLQMENHFFLSTETDSSEISPDKLKLRYEGRSPNFFEVFIRNAKSDFSLKLESEQKKSREKETIWSCTIRTDDYQNRNTDHEQGQHFVDRHWTALVNRVRETGAILDQLKARGLISNESYDSVRSLNTTQEQMRDILTFVTSAGQRSKDLFYEILKGLRCLQPLISELEGSR